MIFHGLGEGICCPRTHPSTSSSSSLLSSLELSDTKGYEP